MTPELKSFLTDLLAVLEKHDAEMVDSGTYIGGEYAGTRIYEISAEEIKQALEQ